MRLRALSLAYGTFVGAMVLAGMLVGQAFWPYTMNQAALVRGATSSMACGTQGTNTSSPGALSCSTGICPVGQTCGTFSSWGIYYCGCSGTTAVSSAAMGKCSNGILEGLEACDDSNRKNGDGCSASCSVEAGCSCYTLFSPTTCWCTGASSSAGASAASGGASTSAGSTSSSSSSVELGLCTSPGIFCVTDGEPYVPAGAAPDYCNLTTGRPRVCAVVDGSLALLPECSDGIDNNEDGATDAGLYSAGGKLVSLSTIQYSCFECQACAQAEANQRVTVEGNWTYGMSTYEGYRPNNIEDSAACDLDTPPPPFAALAVIPSVATPLVASLLGDLTPPANLSQMSACNSASECGKDEFRRQLDCNNEIPPGYVFVPPLPAGTIRPLRFIPPLGYYGRCLPYLGQEGELCTVDAHCAEPLGIICMEGKCIAPRPLGAVCSPTTPIVPCAPGAECRLASGGVYKCTELEVYALVNTPNGLPACKKFATVAAAQARVHPIRARDVQTTIFDPLAGSPLEAGPTGGWWYELLGLINLKKATNIATPAEYGQMPLMGPDRTTTMALEWDGIFTGRNNGFSCNGKDRSSAWVRQRCEGYARKVVQCCDTGMNWRPPAARGDPPIPAMCERTRNPGNPPEGVPLYHVAKPAGRIGANPCNNSTYFNGFIYEVGLLDGGGLACTDDDQLGDGEIGTCSSRFRCVYTTNAGPAAACTNKPLLSATAVPPVLAPPYFPYVDPPGGVLNEPGVRGYGKQRTPTLYTDTRCTQENFRAVPPELLCNLPAAPPPPGPVVGGPPPVGPVVPPVVAPTFAQCWARGFVNWYTTFSRFIFTRPLFMRPLLLSILRMQTPAQYMYWAAYCAPGGPGGVPPAF